MGKKLEDLFKTKNPKTGEIPANTYAPRNSKDIPITTYDPVLNATSVKAVNSLRQRIGIRKSETRLEQETTGIRAIYTLSSPYIYGTDVNRITLQRTDQVEAMKTGDTGSAGVIGGAIEELRNRVKTTLGYPTNLNPTTVNQNDKFSENQYKHKIPEILAEIRGSADGSIVGKFLNQGGTPPQLAKQAIGSALNAVKTKARGILFGEKGTTRFADIEGDTGWSVTRNYGSKDQPSESVRTDEGRVDADGTRYSKTFVLQIRDDTTETGINFVDGNDESVDGFIGLARKTPTIIIPHRDERPAGKTKYSQIRLNDSIETKRGLFSGNGVQYSARDIINRYGVSDSDTIMINDTPLDEYDFIPLKFTRIHDRKTVYFRTIIDGLSETYTPGWDSAKFIGSPFSHYTYTGIDRSISFGLKIAALNELELRQNWERLSFLAGLTYPVDYVGDVGYTIAPLIEFTLGDMYIKKAGFIESLSLSIDDNTIWEIGLTTTIDGEKLRNYKLPTIISVSLGLKFIENRQMTDNYNKLYSYTPITNIRA